jgi:hypothetical protein
VRARSAVRSREEWVPGSGSRFARNSLALSISKVASKPQRLPLPASGVLLVCFGCASVYYAVIRHRTGPVDVDFVTGP